MLKIVVSQYVQQGSKVRCALLDTSKAFDMVDHGHLFDLLLQCKLPHRVRLVAFSDSLNPGTPTSIFKFDGKAHCLLPLW